MFTGTECAHIVLSSSHDRPKPSGLIKNYIRGESGQFKREEHGNALYGGRGDICSERQTAQPRAHLNRKRIQPQAFQKSPNGWHHLTFNDNVQVIPPMTCTSDAALSFRSKTYYKILATQQSKRRVWTYQDLWAQKHHTLKSGPTERSHLFWIDLDP